MKLILASASPRRRELLTAAGYDFTVYSLPVDETVSPDIPPREAVRLLAERKGRAVASALGDGEPVLSADTLVELDGAPLGKPRDAADAMRMLHALSGRTHAVHTGVAVHYRGQYRSETATTLVRFRTLSEEEIARYVASGEPMDKAGAYGIQGKGGALVESRRGDLDTVIGLSVRTVRSLLSACGVEEALLRRKP